MMGTIVRYLKYNRPNKKSIVVLPREIAKGTPAGKQNRKLDVELLIVAK